MKVEARQARARKPSIKTYSFAVKHGGKQIVHYATRKPSLPQAVMAFRKFFGSWYVQGVAYSITCHVDAENVWAWEHLKSDVIDTKEEEQNPATAKA